MLTSLWIVAVVAVSQLQGQSTAKSPGENPVPLHHPSEPDTTHSPIPILVGAASAAAAVGSAALAYHYMSRADAAYERYLNAGHPSEMNRTFDQAREFDRKAGISLAVFEACFALTVYLVFSSLPQ